jgi:hypothetical protein
MIIPTERYKKSGRICDKKVIGGRHRRGARGMGRGKRWGEWGKRRMGDLIP